MLAERALERPRTPIFIGSGCARELGVASPTSRGRRAAPARGSPRARCRASGRPGPSRPRRSSSASSKNVVAWTMALAMRAGSSLLKMPQPTKTPSAPSCITSAASAGVLMPPATKLTTGSLPVGGDVAGRARTAPGGPWRRRTARPRACACRRRISLRTSRSWRTASTMLPVPASPLVRIIAAPSLIRRSASPRFRQPHTNGTLNACLSMWLRLVGRGQDLGLVDVVDAERLEDLGLDEVADAGLGHDRDASPRP